MSRQDLIPLVILGGSDRRPAHMPPDGRDHHPLRGAKGILLRIDGRPLVVEIADRFRATGRFGPVLIAGPAQAYRAAGIEEELIDTDGTFGGNIRAGIEAVVERLGSRRLAMATCDILPTSRDLEIALDNLDAQNDPELWFPIVEAPTDRQQLGESAWKPRYFVIPEGADEQVPVLPGHLALFRPATMRLEFAYGLLESAYRSRNRSINTRRAYMLRRLLLGILYQDLLDIVRFRLPTLTWDTIVWGVRGARKLRDGAVTQHELEETMRHLFVRYRHRRSDPTGVVRMPILPTLSLARDIDTVEEAQDLGATPDSEASVTAQPTPISASTGGDGEAHPPADDDRTS